MFLTSDSRTLSLFLLTFCLILKSHLGSNQTMAHCDFMIVWIWEIIFIHVYRSLCKHTTICMFPCICIKICSKYYIVFRGNYAKRMHSSLFTHPFILQCLRSMSVMLGKLFNLSWPSCLIFNTVIPKKINLQTICILRCLIYPEL